MLPRLFLIEKVDPKSPAPVASALVKAGGTYKEFRECSRCGFALDGPAYDIHIHGFDDLLEVDSGMRAFLFSGMPPLIATRENVSLVATHLTGAIPRLVGYEDWNQRDGLINASNRYTHPPLLGALMVTALCSEACDQSGNPIPHCSVCGHLVAFGLQLGEDKQKVFPMPAAWPGTDLFLVEGLSQGYPCITEDGLRKLRELGFANLLVTEWQWHVA